MGETVSPEVLESLNLLPRRICTNFRVVRPGRGPNPRVISGVTYLVRDHAGAPTPDTVVTTWGPAPFTGLNCGFELEITWAPGRAAQGVELVLVHFSQPASVEAFSGGASVGTASMSGPQKVAETLRINGAGIDRVVVTAPADETLLLRFCRVGVPPIIDLDPLDWKDIKDLRDQRIQGLADQIKELTDGKDPRKDNKDFREGPVDEDEIINPSPLLQRLDRIESMLAEVAHFIRPEQRVDLGGSALNREPDIAGEGSARTTGDPGTGRGTPGGQ